MRTPLALQSPLEISLGLLGVGLAESLSVVLPEPDTHPISLVADAIGLAAFTTPGAIVASGANVSAFGVVAIATINAVGGGALADILLDRPLHPLRGLLRELRRPGRGRVPRRGNP